MVPTSKYSVITGQPALGRSPVSSQTLNFSTLAGFSNSLEGSPSWLSLIHIFTYDKFIEMVDDGDVKEVTLQSNTLTITGKPYLERITKTIPNETIIQNRSPESGVNKE